MLFGGISVVAWWDGAEEKDLSSLDSYVQASSQDTKGSVNVPSRTFNTVIV